MQYELHRTVIRTTKQAFPLGPISKNLALRYLVHGNIGREKVVNAHRSSFVLCPFVVFAH